MSSLRIVQNKEEEEEEEEGKDAESRKSDSRNG
jgi:hypothetical protein